MRQLTFFAATAAICKTFFTSGFFLLVPNALLRNLEACPKNPVLFCDSEAAMDD